MDDEELSITELPSGGGGASSSIMDDEELSITELPSGEGGGGGLIIHYG